MSLYLFYSRKFTIQTINILPLIFFVYDNTQFRNTSVDELYLIYIIHY